MVIKPAGKIALIILFLVLAFFSYRYFNPAEPGAPGAESSSTTAPDQKSGDEKSSTREPETKPSSTSPSSEIRSFNYVPEKPVDPTLRGVVEVGASGFNSFVINMDKEKRWEIVSKDFGESLAYEGLMTTEDIRTGLKKYLGKMFDKGVNSRNMHFVISSGAQKEPKTTTIANELKKMGFVVNQVTAAQEGKFALKATVPPTYTDNSFLVDIGSGNTKISWNENGNLRSMELPGSKYYDGGKSDEVIYDQIKSEVARIPKRKEMFALSLVAFPSHSQSRAGQVKKDSLY